MDFEKICMMFTMQEPFYGVMLSSMNRTPTDIIPTLGVRRSGKVFQLCYNPKYIESLPTDSVLELLKHEVLHIALGHFTLWDFPAITQEENDIRNSAEDLEVNCYLKKDIIKSLNGLLPEVFGWENRAGTVEYHKRLTQKVSEMKQQMGSFKGNQNDQDQNNQNQNENQESNSNNQSQDPKTSPQSNSPQRNKSNQAENKPQSQNAKNSSGKQRLNEQLGKGDMLDDHSMWPKDEAEKEEIQTQVDSLLVYAAEEVEKSCGEIPGELKKRIELLRKKPKPVTDWKRYCRRYIGNSFSDEIKRSKKRESKRFPDAAGKRHRRKSRILVAIDTSGSISMPEYQEFMGQIKTLDEHAEFHVLECDTEIQHEYEFRGIIPDTVHGGGGTSFYPPVEYFHKHKKEFDSLIYFTDGLSSVPHNLPKKTLWVLSSKGIKDKSKLRVNGASVVQIKKQQ